MDFKITETGELIKEDESVDKQNYIMQMARSRLKSISSDWYYDKIGANIEEMFGRLIDEDVRLEFENKIISALTFDDLFNSKNIYVRTHLDTATLSVKADIFIRNVIDIDTSELITVNLDLFNGILEM